MSPDQKNLAKQLLFRELPKYNEQKSAQYSNNRPPGGLLLVQEAPQLLLKKVLLILAHIWTKD